MVRQSEQATGWLRRSRPRTAALLWSLLIALLLVAPVPGAEGGHGWFQTLEALGADKLVHLALFAVQALLVWRWLHSAGLRAPGLWAVLAAVAYGALTELVQRSLPARHGDLLDLAADGFGALLGALLAHRWDRAG